MFLAEIPQWNVLAGSYFKTHDPISWLGVRPDSKHFCNGHYFCEDWCSHYCFREQLKSLEQTSAQNESSDDDCKIIQLESGYFFNAVSSHW